MRIIAHIRERTMSESNTVMRETTEQQQAFNIYYNLGMERSYAKVAMRIGKSLSSIEKWGKIHKWTERVEKKEAEKQTKIVEKQNIENSVDFIQRNLKIVKKGIADHLTQIQAGKMKCTYSNLETLMNLELKLRTGYDAKIKVDHTHDVRNMTNDDLRGKIEELFKQVETMTTMTHRNQIPKIDVVDADYKEIQTKGDTDHEQEQRQSDTE